MIERCDLTRVHMAMQDLDKNPQKIDKFRRASLEARRASLNSAHMNAAKGDAAPAQEPGALANTGRYVIMTRGLGM